MPLYIAGAIATVLLIASIVTRMMLPPPTTRIISMAVNAGGLLVAVCLLTYGLKLAGDDFGGTVGSLGYLYAGLGVAVLLFSRILGIILRA